MPCRGVRVSGRTSCEHNRVYRVYDRCGAKSRAKSRAKSKEHSLWMKSLRRRLPD
jgi:hypothetical protein